VITTPEQHESVAKKIRALLAMAAPGSGATEAETILAAHKARELMDTYNITQTEAELRADPVVEDIRWSQGRYDDYAKLGIPSAVAKYTDTTIWYDRNGRLHVLGQQADVTFARWLLDTLMGFVARGAAEYQGSHTEKRNFAMSAAARICRRMLDEVEARNKAKPQGRDLVDVTKQALIKDWLDAQGLKFRKGSKKEFDANAAGLAHGDAARWDKPVGNTDDTRRLK